MKLKLVILFSALIWSFAASAQWTPMANFPGVARAKSTAFTIAGKIYMMGGVDNGSNILKDFWEYDIATNTWLQKPNFPGPERYGAVSFVLGNQGYIATGGNDFGYLDDLWQYDPATGNWQQKTGLPAGSAQHENQRTEAFSFVIGNLAYVGGGSGFVFGANSTFNIAFSDLWEYNPASNLWIPKSSIPDFLGRNMSIGATINNKGYVGLGCDVNQSTGRQSFWEYNPLTDIWIAKADFPTNFNTDAGAFVLNSNLYVLGGVNFSPFGLSSQFYKYDPVTDSWLQLPAFNGSAIAGEFVVSTGTSAFAGGGYTAGVNTRNDLWEYTTSTTGIGDDMMQSGVANIYPNPAISNITVSSSKEISSVEVYDVAGKNVLRSENADHNIDVQHLETGIYNMKFSFEDGSFVYRRFVKTNR